MREFDLFDRKQLKIKPLAERVSKLNVTSILSIENPLPSIDAGAKQEISELANRIKEAKSENAPVILLYGAHLFRNGLSPFVNQMIEQGYIDHLVTNGAGVIHDWEMSFHGNTTEDVSKYMQEGQFGIWEETGLYQNLAILLGAAEGLGYGEAIGKLISEDHLQVPSFEAMKFEIESNLNQYPLSESLPTKVSLLKTIEEFDLESKFIKIPHKHKNYSIVYNAYKYRIPFSVCPGIGYDIIYTHPLNSGSAIGRSALTDFLMLAETITKLNKGVVLVVGSSVMAPQVFEKAFSMAKNLLSQKNKSLDDFSIWVSDIQPGTWDWSHGEPPADNPAYFLRFCKSFSRLGGRFNYLELDNRVFIQHLHNQLKSF